MTTAAIARNGTGDIWEQVSERHISQAETDLEALAPQLGLDTEIINYSAWPRRNERARQYDELIAVLLRFHTAGQGIRYRITDINRSICSQSSLYAALRRMGTQDKRVTTQDIKGFRYVRLVDGIVRRKAAEKR